MKKTWLVLAALLVLMCAFAGSAMADPVSYYDPELSSTLTRNNYTNLSTLLDGGGLSGNENVLGTGWYVLDANILYNYPIIINGNVHLILNEDCVLDVEPGRATSGVTGAGIQVSPGSTLTIYGENSRTDLSGGIIATATPTVGAYYAGIGGADGNSGTIIIKGGTINATGTNYGAGIGGANDGNGGTITIWHGVVTAYGGEKAAGIGGGDGGVGSTGGIAIIGGYVQATGGVGGAGIGGGYGADSGIISISGSATVIATGGEPDATYFGGAGIGGGGDSGILDSLRVTGKDAKIRARGVDTVTGTVTLAGASVGAGSDGADPGEEAPKTVVTPGTAQIDMPLVFSVEGITCVNTTYQWQYSDGGSLWTDLTTYPTTDATYRIDSVTSDVIGRQYRCIVNHDGRYGIYVEPIEVKLNPLLKAKPDIKIDFLSETLYGFKEGLYQITIKTAGKHSRSSKTDTFSMKANGELPVENASVGYSWFGATLTIVELDPSSKTTEISEKTTLSIPDRPTLTLEDLLIKSESVDGQKDGKVQAANVLAKYTLARKYGTTWQVGSNNTFMNLENGAYWFRIQPQANGWFASEGLNVTIGRGAIYLTMTIPEFDVVKEGYEKQPAEAGIIIHNSGSETVKEVSVTKSGDKSNAFVLSPSGKSYVSAGGNNTIWKLRPALGLKKGTYTATIIVSVDGTQTLEGTATFTVLANTDDPQPSDGEFTFNVNSDGTGAIGFTLSNTTGAVPVTLSVKDADGNTVTTVTGTTDAKGNASLSLTDAQMKLLVAGKSYSLYVSSPGNDDTAAITSTYIGKLTRPSSTATTWSVPTTFKATDGISYQLVTATGTTKPTLTVTSSKPNVVKVDSATGAITAALQSTASDNTVNVTFTDLSGNTQSCTVTVVANRFDRESPLRIAGKYGVFSSTYRLYYEGNTLKVETFLLNKRKDKKITKAGSLTLVIYQNSTPVFSKKLSTWVMTSPLKYNGRAVYQISLTPAELGSSDKLDLASGTYQAVLTRASNVLPVLGTESGAVTQKGVVVRDMIVQSREIPGINNMP